MADFPDISGMFARVSNVRLRGGVVGKVSTVLIAVCLAMAIISWSVRLWWISLHFSRSCANSSAPSNMAFYGALAGFRELPL
jgi:hypothetical protein